MRLLIFAGVVFLASAGVAPADAAVAALVTRRPILRVQSHGQHALASRSRADAPASGARALSVLRGGAVSMTIAPHWSSLIPPLATIVVSLAAKQVILALLAGLWTGSWLVCGNPVVALLRAVDTYALDAMADTDHAGILLFTLLLGGAIGVIQRTGGSLGLARAFGPLASTRRRASGTTFGLSSLIFFDDYSSVLIVGNSLRKPVALAGLSIKKFSMLVHALATCVASLSPVSSWTGLQLGYVAGAVSAAGLSIDGFSMMLATLPYRLLPMLFIAICALSAFSGRDFGVIADAEAEAAARTPAQVRADAGGGTDAGGGGPLEPKAGTPLRPLNAVIPFAAIIVVAFVGMLVDGTLKLGASAAGAGLFAKLAACDSVRALIWAALAGTVAAVVLSLSQRILTVQEALAAWSEGLKEVLEPCVILVLAWALGAVIADVKAADFLAGILKGGLPKFALPPLLSILCYAMSYATGSAAGTMGVVFPLAAPLAASLGEGDFGFVKNCFGAILGCSLFGNICSPIADTSIMTVLATKVSLPDHISAISQYSLLAGAVALLSNVLLSLGVVGPGGALAVGCALLCALWTRARPEPKAKLTAA